LGAVGVLDCLKYEPDCKDLLHIHLFRGVCKPGHLGDERDDGVPPTTQHASYVRIVTGAHASSMHAAVRVSGLCIRLLTIDWWQWARSLK